MVFDRFVRFSRAVVNWNEKAKGVEVVLLEETNEVRDAKWEYTSIVEVGWALQ
jgi:hypothetical protein